MGMIIQNGKVFSGEPKTTYKERVLWNGPATPPNSGMDITLTDAISNYDEIVFKIDKYQNTYAGESAFTVSLLTIGDQYISTVYTGSYQGAYWDYLSDTSIKIRSTSSTTLQTYVKIIGIKYGDTVKRKDYHVYSTEEQIVGEWIDGSTIYEKTFFLSQRTPITNDYTTYIIDDTTIYDIDNIISCEIFDSNSDSAPLTKLAYLERAIDVIKSNNKLIAFYNANNTYKMTGFILRYTKSNT